MAFGSKKIINEKNTDQIDSLDEKEESNSLDFLTPNKNAKKDALNDPYQEEMIRKTAYQYTLKTLNALKIVSPIITALMQKPGIDAPNEEISSSFRLLIKEISNVSGVVCEKIGVDPGKEKNYWIRNVLEKSFAEILKEQWVYNEKIETEKIVDLIEDIIKFGEKTSDTIEYEELSENSLLKVANIKAMLPIIKESQTNFDLYRNLEDDIEKIMTKLFEKSSMAVDKLADDYANSSDRSKLFYVIMQQAGELYSCAWNSEGKRVKEIINSYSPEKLQKSLERYKSSGGFPLDKIDHDFDKYFDKMVVITDKLINSQKSGLDKKLKNK